MDALTCVNQDFVSDCINNRFQSFGQENILIEEMAELTKAICKKRRADYEGQSTHAAVVEEMAHVLCSIEIVAKVWNITSGDIRKEINKKCEKYGFPKEEIL